MNDFKPVASQRRLRQRLRERLRIEWLAATEEQWRRRHGRPTTADELERVLRSYPGDL